LGVDGKHNIYKMYYNLPQTFLNFGNHNFWKWKNCICMS